VGLLRILGTNIFIRNGYGSHKIAYDFAQGYLRASKDEFWGCHPIDEAAKRMVEARCDDQTNTKQTSNKVARAGRFNVFVSS
jgi:hypothetical protein